MSCNSMQQPMPTLDHPWKMPTACPFSNPWPAACLSLPAFPQGAARLSPTKRTVSCYKTLAMSKPYLYSCASFVLQRNLRALLARPPSEQPQKNHGTHMLRACTNISCKFFPANPTHRRANCISLTPKGTTCDSLADSPWALGNDLFHRLHCLRARAIFAPALGSGAIEGACPPEKT